MPLSLTEFRANLYKIVDQVIKTGAPIEIERRGVKIRLIFNNIALFSRIKRFTLEN